jgi:hypothetical protein
MKKEVVMAYFMALLQHLPGVTKSRKPQECYPLGHSI